MLNFAHPGWLFVIVFLPLLGLINWQQLQRERRDLESYARNALWEKLDLRPGKARWRRGVMLIAALACGVIALAEPRWGGGPGGSEATQQAGNLVIALDVSKSMLTRDLNGESRLNACQRLLKEALPELAAWKIGVVAFAGDAIPLVPLTTDHAAVATLLERAQPGTAPGKGTSVEAGLKSALGLLSQPGREVILLMTDGEELSGQATAVLPALSDHHIQVLAVGAGTTEGGYIPGAVDLWGNPAYVTYRGDKVVSHLQAGLLQKLGSETDGLYVSAADDDATATLLKKLGRGAPTTQGVPDGDAGFELFQLPLGLAFVLVAADAFLSLFGRSRRELRFAELLRERLRQGALVVFLGSIALLQGGWTWYPSWLPNREAADAYQARQYPKAEQLLDGALKADPENFRLLYNAGMVAYREGRFDRAATLFQQAWDLADEQEKPVIGYNLGNAHFRQAEAGNDPQGFEAAIGDYQRVLSVRPHDADAQHNLAVAQRRLRQAKKAQAKSGQHAQQQSDSQGGAQGQNPVGADPQPQPSMAVGPLPSDAEVDALLKALESDERQRQSEAGLNPPSDDGQADPFNQQPKPGLLQQAEGMLDMEKDW